MVHLCADEVGMVMAVIGAVGAAVKPIRDCVKCQAVYLYRRVRGK